MKLALLRLWRSDNEQRQGLPQLATVHPSPFTLETTFLLSDHTFVWQCMCLRVCTCAGVICDSQGESSRSGFRALETLWPDMVEQLRAKHGGRKGDDAPAW